MVSSCLIKSRKEGILIPQCPPRNSIELGGPQAEANYYLFAFSERAPYKATYDMLLPIGNRRQ